MRGSCCLHGCAIGSGRGFAGKAGGLHATAERLPGIMTLACITPRLAEALLPEHLCFAQQNSAIPLPLSCNSKGLESVLQQENPERLLLQSPCRLA